MLWKGQYILEFHRLFIGVNSINKVMILGEKELSGICGDFLKNNSQFLEAYDIAQRNSEGGSVWLFGGYLYRNLIERIYGMRMHSLSKTDIDFMIDGQKREPYMAQEKGWKFGFTSRRDPSFQRLKVKVDLNDLRNYYPLILENLAPTIENVLAVAPINIQSLAYEFKIPRLIIGEDALYAINNRVLQVKDMRMARQMVEQLKVSHPNISLERILRKRARELGFRYEPPKKI